MNPRNLVCWAGVLAGYTLLLLWGNSQPIAMERGRRSPWAKFWLKVEAVPLPGQVPKKAPAQKPPPPPPPSPMSRAEAEQLIRGSALLERADDLIPRLRRSIRVSPLPVDAAEELPRGTSRLAAPPDVPAGFEWPRVNGQPLALIAQIRLRDVASLDEDKLLPQTGWLCFFYACALKPPPTGRQPADRAAWQVVYFDTEVNALQRRQPPKPLKTDFPPCALRFWQEWTLPSAEEEPELARGEQGHFYQDLCEALSGRPKETGWHHLLGYAQNLAGPMRPVCELASKGVAVSHEADLDDPNVKAQSAGAKDWVLLFQIELDALAAADAPPDPAPVAARGTLARRMWDARDRLYFWIRQTDLRAHDFSRVWVQRQEPGKDD